MVVELNNRERDHKARHIDSPVLPRSDIFTSGLNHFQIGFPFNYRESQSRLDIDLILCIVTGVCYVDKGSEVQRGILEVR